MLRHARSLRDTECVSIIARHLRSIHLRKLLYSTAAHGVFRCLSEESRRYRFNIRAWIAPLQHGVLASHASLHSPASPLSLFPNRRDGLIHSSCNDDDYDDDNCRNKYLSHASVQYVEDGVSRFPGGTWMKVVQDGLDGPEIWCIPSERYVIPDKPACR